MGELGQAEFKSLEAAVRDRLSTWTRADADLHFAVLDYPSTLETRLSQQLLEREMNAEDVGDDPGRARMDYLYALDKVANAVVVGNTTVAPKTETVGKIYGDILNYGQPLPKRLSPAEQTELDRHRAVLYVLNPDTGLLDTTPALALYQSLSSDVMRKSMELQQAQAEHGADSIEARMKQQALDFAETDLLVRGQKNRIEEAQARIRVLSTNSTELWQRALLDLEDSLLMDAETTDSFPVSRCPPVPDTNWMQISLDMRSNSTGAVLGLNEKLLSLEAEIFLVPVDRSGWMQTGVLTQVPWKWGIMGRSGQLSDGKGGGELPYLPEHLVLMRDIKLTVQIPFENDGSAPKAKLPKIGRMAVPLQVRAVDGRRLAAPQARMEMKAQAAPAQARAADLRAMRTAQLMRQRTNGRALRDQMSALQARPRAMAAPSAPKVQALKMMGVKAVLQQSAAAGLRAQIGVGGFISAGASTAAPDLKAAQNAVNKAKNALRLAQREKQQLGNKGLMKALHKKQHAAVDRKIRNLTTKLKQAENHLKSERARAQQIAEAARRAAAEAQARADEARRKREEEEARRRAPSPVAIAVHGIDGDDWVPRESKLTIRDSRGRITNASTNAQGEARLELAPGSYTAQVSLLNIDETSETIRFECAMGEPVSQVMTVLPKWKNVELTACEPGGEVLLLGYLLRSLPELPQVIDAASVDTEIPDLVG